MQVSQIAELDSHAVIGGGASQSFFMSDSAEFFTILSDTLYRDKALAVVREVTCNAHDAHVMGKCLDKPIVIQLSDTELSIQDFGPGIAAERMHSVYCGYGVSTKVDDVTQIGGFGLGCKAPFAYSDHFSVTSCHAGLRTVYSISRGGLESDGKPAMRQMVQVPTQETGITVSIPIKNKGDVANFRRLIEQVVKNGGMKATLNGVAIKVHDFTGIEKTGFGVIPDDELQEGPVYVRLGSVLYPLTTDNPELSKLVQVFSNNKAIKLILWARPGEVGVTPSREALSYSEGTIAYLTERLNKARRHIMGLMPKAMRQLADKHVSIDKTPRVSKTLNRSLLPFCIQTTDPETIARIILSAAIREDYGSSFSAFKIFAGSQEKALLKAAMHKHRDYRAVFRRALGYSNKGNAWSHRYSPNRSEWLGESGSLLIRTCARLGILDHVARYTTSGGSKGLTVKPLKQCADAWPCKPTIVFCRTRAQAEGHAYGDKAKSIAYIVTQRLKTHQIDEAENTLIQKGFACERLNLEKPAPQPKAPKVIRPTETFYDLSDVGGWRHCVKLNQNAKTGEAAPVFIECGNLRDGEFQASMREILLQKDKILKLFPKVSLAIGAQQKKALIAAGSKEFKELISAETKELTKTPDNMLAFAAARGGLFTRRGEEDETTFIANCLSKHDLRFTKLFTGQRVVVSQEQQRVFNIAAFWMTGVAGAYPGWSHYYDLRKACEKKSITQNLDYLLPIWAIFGNGYREKPIEWSEDLCEVIRFLQRRHAKYNLQLVKEAT